MHEERAESPTALARRATRRPRACPQHARSTTSSRRAPRCAESRAETSSSPWSALPRASRGRRGTVMACASAQNLLTRRSVRCRLESAGRPLPAIIRCLLSIQTPSTRQALAPRGRRARCVGVAVSTHYARRSWKPVPRELAGRELLVEIEAARSGYRRVYGARKARARPGLELRRRGIDVDCDQVAAARARDSGKAA